MANVIIASKDPICQSAMQALLKNPNTKQGPPYDSLQDKEYLVILAHDGELGDGTPLISLLQGHDTPMTKFQVVLIVCKAASLNFATGITTPAEALANHFKRSVYAAKDDVLGVWHPTGAASFTGSFVKVDPGTDITSKMGNLKVN